MSDKAVITEGIIMKTKRHFAVVSLSVAVACVSFVFWSCTGPKLDETVQQAYELRMNGKADEAKAVLEQAIAEDSTNADALYELARAELHIGLGNLGELRGSLEDIHQTIEKAVENDPDNVAYSFYKGYVCLFRAYASATSEQPDVKERVEEVISAYESVLSLKPDYYEAMLYLVEVLGIPEDMRLITLVNIGKRSKEINPILSEPMKLGEKQRPPRKELEDFVYINDHSNKLKK